MATATSDHTDPKAEEPGGGSPSPGPVESLLNDIRSHVTDADIEPYLVTAREYIEFALGKVASYQRENPAKFAAGVAALAVGAGLIFSEKRRKDDMNQMQEVIDAMMPRTPVPLPPMVLQARRNAEARDALFKEFGGLTSAQIGEMAGSKSPNRAALAHRWKTDRRIFAVPHQGVNYFPGFQFSQDGQPLPVIAAVLAVLADRWSAWEVALWFTSRVGWLGARRPVDLLESEPDAVVEAAAHDAEELVF